MTKRKRKKKKQAESGQAAGDSGETSSVDEQRQLFEDGTEAADECPQDGAESAAVGSEGEEGMMVPLSALREVERQRDEYLDMAKRAQADLENYRRRVSKERETLKRESLGYFLKECLSAFHDLDRVLAEGEKAEDFAAFHAGVKLSRDNLWKTLGKVGVAEIPALGKPFDPNLHEALTAIPSADHDPNTVIEVFQPGFMLDDFVLSPARVIVSAAPAEAETKE